MDIYSLKLDAVSHQTLAGLDLYSPWRNGTGFSVLEQEKISLGELRKSLELGGAAFKVSYGGEAIALISVEPLPWDSQHYGFPMARVRLFSSKNASANQLDDLLRYALCEFQSAKEYRHYTIEVDIDNYHCLNALTRSGFQIEDIKRTYFYTSGRLRKDINIRFSNGVRKYQNKDYARVMDIISITDFPSRFTRSESLCPIKSKDLKEVWFSNLLKKPDSDRLALVYEKAGKIEACSAIDCKDFSAFGVDRRMMYGGLYASTSKGTGAYQPILYRLTQDALKLYGVGATVVSMNNMAPLRVLESFGCSSGSVVSYALSKSL